MSVTHERVLRREDEPLLLGRGTFIDNLRLPELEGSLQAVFVRSVEPHARITGIDADEARSLAGVVGVYTGADVRDVLWPLPPRLPNMTKGMWRPMLADDRVKFVGEALAVVVATSRAIATDAAELVIVDYERLPVITDLNEALASETLLYDAVGTNVSMSWAMPAFEDDPFAECDEVVEFTLRHPRLAPAPIEPRAGAAVWGSDGRLTSYVCSQRPAGAKHVIECSLGLEPGTVRAIAPDVGGGFGAKGGWGCYPEDVVLAWLSRETGRPVRWSETRSESMLAMGHGRASTHTIRIGGDRDGVVKAYEVHALQDSGCHPAMGTNVTGNLRNSGTGVYAFPRARVSGTSVVTNTTPTVAFRGAGRPEAACDVERAMDRFAVAVGLDPVEVRLRNVVPEDAFPYTTAIGSTYDSGRYALALTRCVEAAGYEALRAEQTARRQQGGPLQLGIGVSCTVEITGGGEGETASVAVHDDGTVTVVVGTSPHGQGHETTFADVVMRELGIDRSRIIVRHSDTDLSPFGGGTIGSRSAQLGGSAAYGAARDVVELGRRRAAELLEADVADIVFEAGSPSSGVAARFLVAGTPARALAWTDLGPLDAEHRFKPEGGAGTFAFGACVAVVELDTETGMTRVRKLVTVDDAGTILNPMIAEGQVHGGLGLAVAAALYEEMVYEDGVPRTANLADYALISATELVAFETIEMETPSPWNPLGVKGVGESGTVVATPALHSAVLDALAPLGVVHVDLPCTPERVWNAMQSAAAESAARSTAGAS